LFIHDVDSRTLGLLRFDDCSFETQLELGFSSTIQLLVDRWVVAIEGDVGASRIGETVELHLELWRNGKEETKL